jgi:Protein of unknown function (DUF3667)
LQVSHFTERKEKNCLNCNAVVQGRFCHICGQENIEPRETLWHLVSHFFQDITHFDGKFFSTLKYLLFKPGFLSREYMMGRRASYLNPIRMYVFTSAFFFLYFFSTFSLDGMNSGFNAAADTQVKLDKLKLSVEGLKKQQEAVKDTVIGNAIQKTLLSFNDRVVLYEKVLDSINKDTTAIAARLAAIRDSVNAAVAGDPERLRPKKKKDGINFNFMNEHYYTVMAYDSVQANLPAGKRDGWWRRLRNRKAVDIYEKSSDKSTDFGKHVVNTFLHALPQMFFFSLPVFAFLLSLLNRKGRKYYYVNHAIFSIHLYCATFIITFILILLTKYAAFGNETVENIYSVFFFFALFFYQYKCMRNFYQQSRAKTVLKFFIINMLAFAVTLLLTIVFFMITLWKV